MFLLVDSKVPYYFTIKKIHLSSVLQLQGIVQALHIPMLQQPTESFSCFTGHVGTSFTNILEFLFSLYKTTEAEIVYSQPFKKLCLNAKNTETDDNVGLIEEQDVLTTA